MLGRLVEARTISLPQPSDSRWQNVMRVIRHFNTREVPEAEVEVRFAGDQHRACAPTRRDTSGASSPAGPAGRRRDAGTSWHPVDLELCGCPLPGWAPLATRTEVLIPSPRATLGIVSDIDDTVLQTHVTRRLRMLWVTFSRNAHTRLPFPGTSDLYRALVGGPTGTAHNPVFYVSKSPWNLYDFLVQFLDKHQLPRGPLMLRDLGVSTEAPAGLQERLHRRGVRHLSPAAVRADRGLGRARSRHLRGDRRPPPGSGAGHLHPRRGQLAGAAGGSWACWPRRPGGWAPRCCT